MGKNKAHKAELTIAKESKPEATVEEIVKVDPVAPAEPSEDEDNIFTSIFGSPDKLFDYLTKTLVAFLIFSLYTLFKVDSKQ